MDDGRSIPRQRAAKTGDLDILLQRECMRDADRVCLDKIRPFILPSLGIQE